MSEIKLRELKTKDIYPMSRILKKMDLDFKVEPGTTQMEMGVKMVQGVIENLHMAEKEINSFLGELIGISEEEFAELPIGTVLEVFSQFKNLDNVSSFLELAAKSTK